MIACSGFEADEAVAAMDFDVLKVGVKQAMMAQARRSVLVADAGKFARSAIVRVASLAAFSALVTDAPPPEPMARRMKREDCRVPYPKRRAQVADLLAMMGLGELADRRVDRISGGQRQRVALARAIEIRPRVLLLDEPLAALDAALRERLRVEIVALLRTLRSTAVYVTHDQAEAMATGSPS